MVPGSIPGGRTCLTPYVDQKHEPPVGYEPPVGFEPTTSRLLSGCSTNYAKEAVVPACKHTRSG